MGTRQFIRVTQDDEVTIIHLAAMVNERRIVVEFGEQLLGFVNEQKPSRLQLNFHDVRLFSSEAINDVLRANRRVQEVNGRMTLCGMSPELRNIFRITGLDGTLLEIYDSCSEATDALRE